MGKKDDWTDAEFTVIEPKRLPFWQRYQLTIDWRVFWVVAATSAVALIRTLTETLH